MSDEQEHLRDVHDEERPDSNSIPLWSIKKTADDVIPVHIAINDYLGPDDCAVVGSKMPVFEIRSEPCSNGCCLRVLIVDTANDKEYPIRVFGSVLSLVQSGLLSAEAVEQMASPPEQAVAWWTRKRMATLN